MQHAKARFALGLGVLVESRAQDVFASNENDLDITSELGKRNKCAPYLTCGRKISSHGIHDYAQWTR